MGRDRSRDGSTPPPVEPLGDGEREAPESRDAGPVDRGRGGGEPDPTGEPRGEPRRPSLRGIARRLLFDLGADLAGREDDIPPDESRNARPEGGQGRDRELDDEQRRRLEARAILAALLETGDRAKTETVRLVAREVRGYLEALELGRDIEHLLTNYSLEIQASVHLRPLDAERRDAGPKAAVGLRKRDQDAED